MPALSPEQNQYLTDLARKMLDNTREGRAAHHGITEGEIQKSLAFLRSNRTASAESGAKKAKATKKAGEKADVLAKVVDTKAFTDMDLD